jgi:hypothetical protein
MVIYDLVRVRIKLVILICCQINPNQAARLIKRIRITLSAAGGIVRRRAGMAG